MSDRERNIKRSIDILEKDLRNLSGTGRTREPHLNKIGALSHLCQYCVHFNIEITNNNVILKCAKRRSPADTYMAIELDHIRSCPDKKLIPGTPE